MTVMAVAVVLDLIRFNIRPQSAVRLMNCSTKVARMTEKNRQSDELLLQALVERLNRRLMDEAQSRHTEVERGLEIRRSLVRAQVEEPRKSTA